MYLDNNLGEGINIVQLITGIITAIIKQECNMYDSITNIGISADNEYVIHLKHNGNDADSIRVPMYIYDYAKKIGTEYKDIARVYVDTDSGKESTNV